MSRNPLKISKQKLARKLLISETTLRRWLNIVEYDKLKELGYNKYSKYLYQKQLDYLFPSGIELDVPNKQKTI